MKTTRRDFLVVLGTSTCALAAASHAHSLLDGQLVAALPACKSIALINVDREIQCVDGKWRTRRWRLADVELSVKRDHVELRRNGRMSVQYVFPEFHNGGAAADIQGACGAEVLAELHSNWPELTGHAMCT